MIDSKTIFKGRGSRDDWYDEPRAHKNTPLDELPHIESMSRLSHTPSAVRHSLIDKFLTSQVGKKWDVVYSRLTNRFKPNTDNGAFIREYFSRYSLIGWRFDEFYVDDGGILRKDTYIPKKYVSPKSPVKKINIAGKERYFTQIKNKCGVNIWYELFLKDIPKGYFKNYYPKYRTANNNLIYVETLKDVAFGNISKYEEYNVMFWYGKLVYAYDKKQASSDIIKKYILPTLIDAISD